MDSYLSLVMVRPPQELWGLYLLTLARIIPTIAISPFLGGKVLPDPIKIGFGVALSFIFFPFLMIKAPHVAIDHTPLFMALLIKEAVIGALLGFLISMPYYYLQAAGALIDMQRGAQSLQVTDPLSTSPTSPIGTMFGNLLITLFYSGGGFFLYCQGLLSSFDLIPIDRFIPAALLNQESPLFSLFLGMAQQTVQMILQLSAPALLALLMTDLFLGIANRMAPQVQITFLLYALKAFVAILILLLGWNLMIHQFEFELSKSFHSLIELFSKKLPTCIGRNS